MSCGCLWGSGRHQGQGPHKNIPFVLMSSLTHPLASAMGDLGCHLQGQCGLLRGPGSTWWTCATGKAPARTLGWGMHCPKATETLVLRPWVQVWEAEAVLAGTSSASELPLARPVGESLLPLLQGGPGAGSRRPLTFAPLPSQSQCPRGAAEGAGAASLRGGAGGGTAAPGARVQDGARAEHRGGEPAGQVGCRPGRERTAEAGEDPHEESCEPHSGSEFADRPYPVSCGVCPSSFLRLVGSPSAYLEVVAFKSPEKRGREAGGACPAGSTHRERETTSCPHAGCRPPPQGFLLSWDGAQTAPNEEWLKRPPEGSQSASLRTVRGFGH